MDAFLKTVYFTLPAWLANSLTAVFGYLLIKKYKILPNVPLDFGLKLKGKPIFGKNKSLFGSFFMVVSATLVGLAQGFLKEGFLMGVGVLLGSLGNSFVKRRLNIQEGGNFFPFDQIDYALSTYLILKITNTLPSYFNFYFFLLFVFFYQLFVNFLAFKLGFIDNFLWWKSK